MSVGAHPVGSVGPLGDVGAANATRRPAATPPPGFDRLLQTRLGGSDPSGAVRWSAHAVQRLSQREISITPEMQGRLEGAVDRLAAKGGRESVVLMDQMAFVVSVPNRTVITAVDQTAMRDQVFTNIDSAVLS